MLLSDTPPVRKLAPLYTVLQFKVSIVSRAPHLRTILQNGQDKSSKASPKKLSIMEYSLGLPQDTKSLRSCTGNQAKMLRKSHLGSNVTPKISRSSYSFSTVLPIVNGGVWGCIVRDLETIIVLVLLTFNFIPQKSHHSLTLPRSRIGDSVTKL